MASGWRAARPNDHITVLPMSDGGEGLLAALEAGVPAAARHTAEVADARGHAVDAHWLQLPDGTAVVESAQACGLSRLSLDQRNPRLTTTYGVGQLFNAAAAAGAEKIIVGLGGSATIDGGAGFASAIGHRLLRADGNGVKVGGEYLDVLDRVIATSEITPAKVIAAYDVTAPLLGPSGAVAGFATQKGAAPEDLTLFERNLRRLADVVERDLAAGPWRELPGASAAGGLGFGLAAFAGAELTSGARLVAELIGLPEAITSADLVITGEGRWDEWSTRGKAPGEVLRLGRDANVRVVGIVGADDGSGATHLDDAVVLGPDGLDAPAQAIAAAAQALAERAAQP